MILLAPNGKPSNLTPEQYRLVRTPAFIAWFGDWEKLAYAKLKDSAMDEVTLSNLSKDVSKVVDENGEPMVVYHGSPNIHDINVFKSNKGFEYTFFATDFEEAVRYTANEKNKWVGENDLVKSFFIVAKNIFDTRNLNEKEEADVKEIIRNNSKYFISLYDIDQAKDATGLYDNGAPELDDNQLIYHLLTKYGDNYILLETKQFQDYIKSNKYDSFTTLEGLGGNYAVFNPTQIKLADGTNTTFDANNQDIRFGDGGEVEERKEVYKRWKSLVNMSKGELEKFYDSQEGRDAGLSASEAKEKGIDSGRESARWIMKMKDTPVSDWTPAMWKWAKKQISFISRMRGNKGGLYDDKGKKTRKHTSLLIWGHNPEKNKFDNGGELTMSKPNVADLVTFDNFHSGTIANFTIVSKLELPPRKPDFVSDYGSKYWYEQEYDGKYVYRQSDHWGEMDSCTWFLDLMSHNGLTQGKCKLSDFYKSYDDINDLGSLTMRKPSNDMFEYGGSLTMKKPSVKLTKEEIIYSSSFKNWFGDWEEAYKIAGLDFKHPAWKNVSKAVDENGEPLKLYHGTTHEWTKYSRKLGNHENDMGIGFYATSSLSDAERNYLGGGSDLTARLAMAAEHLQETRNISYERAKKIAEQRIVGDTERVIEVYLNIRKPLIIATKGWSGTNFDFAGSFDDETEQYEDSKDFIKFKDAFDDVSDDFVFTDRTRNEIWSEFMENIGEPDYKSAYQVIQALKRSNSLYEETYDEVKGGNKAYEFVAQVFRKLGFDGVIYLDASEHFKNMGISVGTKHMIAFKPTQIKLADGTNVSFDPKNTDIRYDDGGELSQSRPEPKFSRGQVLNLKGYGEVKVVGVGWLDPPMSPRSGYLYDFKLDASVDLSDTKRRKKDFIAVDFALYEYEVEMMLEDFDTGIDYDKSYQKYLNAGITTIGNPPLDFSRFIVILNRSVYYLQHPEFELSKEVQMSEFAKKYAVYIDEKEKFDEGGVTTKEAHSSKFDYEKEYENYTHVTETENFKKWFGNSKFVDLDGNPKIYYHQTHKKNLQAIEERGFNLNIVGARGSDDQMPDGVFIKNTDEDISVGGKGEDVVQIPVYVRVENPIYFENRSELYNHLKDDEIYWHRAFESDQYDKAMAKKFDEVWRADKEIKYERGTVEHKKQYDEQNKKLQEILEEWKLGNIRVASLARARATEILKSQGYDGIVVRKDTGSFDRVTWTLVVFNPYHVKSAVNNIGTFDITQKGIKYEDGGSVDSDKLSYWENVYNENVDIKNRMEYGFSEKSGRQYGIATFLSPKYRAIAEYCVIALKNKGYEYSVYSIAKSGTIYVYMHGIGSSPTIRISDHIGRGDIFSVKYDVSTLDGAKKSLDKILTKREADEISEIESQKYRLTHNRVIEFKKHISEMGLGYKSNSRTYQSPKVFLEKHPQISFLRSTELGENRYGEMAYKHEYLSAIDSYSQTPPIDYIDWYNNQHNTTFEKGGSVSMCNKLYKDHHEVWDKLSDIEKKVCQTTCEKYSKEIVSMWDAELKEHFTEEEQDLFPSIRNEENKYVISELLSEHKDILKLIDKIKSENNTSDILEFCNFMKYHIKKEENLMSSVTPDPFKKEVQAID